VKKGTRKEDTPAAGIQAGAVSREICRSKLEVTTDAAGLRLDVWLADHLGGLSRSRIQSLIRSGHISVKGRRIEPHSRIAEGMRVDVDIPPVERTQLVAENIPLDVLYEDADIIVVNKPAGLVVHPAAGHRSGTLVNALLNHCGSLCAVGGEMRPGIVHRLDKDTSGVLVVAKNDCAMEALAGQFKDRLVRKEYLAVVHGIPGPTAGRIETLIGRSRHDRKKMTATPDSGRRAVTHYEVLETFDFCCLVRLRMKTGRTHQIRVHMSHIGHPVVGDKQYEKRGQAWVDWPVTVDRQMLHADILAFHHPRGEKELQFRAPLPCDMKILLEALRDSGPSKNLRNHRTRSTSHR